LAHALHSDEAELEVRGAHPIVGDLWAQADEDTVRGEVDTHVGVDAEAHARERVVPPKSDLRGEGVGDPDPELDVARAGQRVGVQDRGERQVAYLHVDVFDDVRQDVRNTPKRGHAGEAVSDDSAWDQMA